MDRVAARCPESGEHADDQNCHHGHFGSVQYRLGDTQSGISSFPGLMRISTRPRTADSSAQKTRSTVSALRPIRHVRTIKQGRERAPLLHLPK